MSRPVPVALTVAGSDSGGGAGIEMDLKVFATLGVYGTCAITALTAQNSREVRSTWEVPAGEVAAQMAAVLDDLPVAAVKTGMLSSEAIVRAVAGVVRERRLSPLVVDPVVTAKDGSRLLSEAGVAALRDELIPLASLVTPNAAEAEALTGVAVSSEEEAWRAAEKLRALGCKWVLVKGGHLRGVPSAGSGTPRAQSRGGEARDFLLGPDGAQVLSSPRIRGGPFHGTGCALSAAITAYLARGEPFPQAVSLARAFLQELLRTAQRLGAGALLLHPSLATPKEQQS